MPVNITIRAVPERIRDEIAARAAREGKSMEEYLRQELDRLVARPTLDVWLEQVRRRKRATQTRVTSRQILEHRDAERK